MMHYQPLLAEAVKKFPAKEWVEAAAVAGMTIQDVRTPEEALADPLFLEGRLRHRDQRPGAWVRSARSASCTA